MDINVNELSLVKFAQTVSSDATLLVDSATTLTKMAMDKYHRDNFLATRFSCPEDYNKLNETVKRSIMQYCATKAGIADLDVTNKESVAMAFTHPSFSWHFFAIQTATLKAVNADNEVEQIMIATNVEDVAQGDSKTYEIESKALFPVQENAYGNLTTRFNEQYKSTITVTPRPRIAGISFDVTEMVAHNYDFGKMMAKIAISFRAQMYKEIVDTIFTVANVSTTPFYNATFAKSTYMQLADRLSAINGAEVTAYGTRVAFGTISDAVSAGFATKDELNKTGFIANLYNVRSVLFDQAVDSSVPTVPFRVPNDKIILLSSVGDNPVKLVKEAGIQVIDDDGKNNSLYRRSYKYLTSWGTGLATQANYGIQSI